MRHQNGFGTAYKLKGNRRRPYIATVTTGWSEEGKQQRETLGFFSKKNDALAVLAEYYKHPYDLEMNKLTFEEIYKRWSQRKFQNISDSNIKGYNAAFNHVDSLHKMRFNDLKAIHLQDAIDTCQRGHATHRKIKNLYSQLYKYAMQNDICEKDYSVFIKNNAEKEESTRKPFSEKEIDFLWDNIDRMDFIDTILVLIYTGFRVGELLKIKTKDIDLKERTLHGGSKSAAGKNRLVPIHNRIFPIIEKYYNPENEYLIVNSKGKLMSYDNYRRERWDKLMEQLDMHHLPHDTRHTFVTRADNYGANEKSVKRIVGHAGKDITDRVYTHKDLEELRKVMELIP